MVKGWRNEPQRHGLSARGIKTTQYRRKTFKNPENRQERLETVWNLDRMLTKLKYFEMESTDAYMDLDNHNIEYYMENGTERQKLIAESMIKMELNIDKEVKKVESMYGYHGTVAVLETLSTKHNYIENYLIRYEENYAQEQEMISMQNKEEISKKFTIKVDKRGNIKG